MTKLRLTMTVSEANNVHPEQQTGPFPAPEGRVMPRRRRVRVDHTFPWIMNKPWKYSYRKMKWKNGTRKIFKFLGPQLHCRGQKWPVSVSKFHIGYPWYRNYSSIRLSIPFNAKYDSRSHPPEETLWFKRRWPMRQVHVVLARKRSSSTLSDLWYVAVVIAPKRPIPQPKTMTNSRRQCCLCYKTIRQRKTSPS